MSAEAHSRHLISLGAFLAASSGESAARIELLRHIAEELALWHSSGRVHRSLDVDHVRCDEQGGEIELLPPAEVVTFGGASADVERTPIALRTATIVDLPVSIAECRRILAEVDLRCTPQRLDLYQFGALACRVLTGRTVTEYLRSPTVSAKVPAAMRQIVDGTLAFDPGSPIESADELVAAFSTLERQDGLRAAPKQASPARASDTDASVMSAVADTSRPPCAPPRGAVSSDSSEPLPWATLGHYQLVRRIGHGGMGDVYLGYEQSLDRHVAIKVLPAELAREPDFVRRFYAEASAAARVVHPHIIPIYFIGEDHGHHYFAMQYVEGESLAALLRQRKRLPIDQTLELLDQVLSGLQAAHAQGLIHRDIKPGNILLDRSAVRVVLADFGLAKSLQPDAIGHTATGVVMGTVDYLSPEQGRGHTVDHRSDLYSLGILAYQLLSGQLPFTADSPTALIFQHVYERPRPLNEVAPDVPTALSATVAKLLAKAPDARHASAAAVRADLAAVRQGQPLPSGADATLARDPYAFSRPVTGVDGPRSAVIQAPTFIQEPELPHDDSMTAVAATWRGRLRAWIGARSPELASQLANTQLQVDDAVAEYERRRHQLAALVHEAESVLGELRSQEAVWRGPDVRPGDTSLRTAEDLRIAREAQESQLETMRLHMARVNARLEQLRAQRHVLNARLRAAQAQLPGTDRRRRSPAWLSPLQLGIVVAAAILMLAAVIRFLVLAPTKQFGSPATVTPTAPNPDAPYVAAPFQTPAAMAAAALARAATRDPETAIEKHLSVSSDGKVLAASSFDPNLASGRTCEIKLWDLDGLREIRTLSEPHRSLGLKLSSDAKWLVSAGMPADGSNRKEVKVWDASTGEVQQVIPADLHPDEDIDVGVFPAGNVACTVLRRPSSALGLFDFASGNTAVIPFPMQQDDATSLATTADGKLAAVAIAQVGFTRTAIDVYDLDSRKMLTSINTGQRILNLRFSADGRWLMGTGRAISLWDTSDWRLKHELAYTQKGKHATAISQDGTYVAVQSYGKVSVWKVADQTRKELSINGWSLDLAFAAGSILVVALPRSQFTFFDASTGRQQLTGVPEGAAAMLPTQVDVEPLWTAKLDQAPAVLTVSAGDNVAVLNANGRLELRSAATGSLIDVEETGRTVNRPVANAAGTLLAGVPEGASAGQSRVRVWNSESQDAVQLPDDPSVTGSPLSYVDGDRVLVTAVDQGDRQDLNFWDLASNTLQRRVSAPATGQASIAIHSSGRAIAVSSPDAVVSILKLDAAPNAGNPEWEPVPFQGYVLEFHPQRRWAMVGGDEGTLVVYDIDARSEVATFRTRDGPVKAAMFDSTGRRCATVGAEGVRVWDMSLGYVRLLIRVPAVTFATFSADGRRLAIADETAQLRLFDTSFPALHVSAQHWLEPPISAGDHALSQVPKRKFHDSKTATTRDGRLVVRSRVDKLELVDTYSDKVLHEFGGVSAVSAIAISPDDRLVATGELNRQTLTADVRLWNLRSGREIRRFHGHVKHCWSIDFSSNGQKLLTGGTGYLHLWDVATGDQVRQIPATMPFAERAAFSQDGRWVIAANNQGTQASAFDVESGDLLVTLHQGYAELLLEDFGLLRDRNYGELHFAAHGD